LHLIGGIPFSSIAHWYSQSILVFIYSHLIPYSMSYRTIRFLCSAFLCLIFSSSLSAQVFQELHAYASSTGLETGQYHDVASLDYIGPAGVNIVGIGISDITPQDAMVSRCDVNGIPLMMTEWWDPTGAPQEGKAIAECPNGDIVFAIFDPTRFETEVIRVTIGGGLVFQTRLPKFRVQDIDADKVPTYIGNEGIFLTGQSSNGQTAIYGLNTFGGLVFGQSYFVVDPNWNFNTTTGFEVEYDRTMNDVVVVGTANIAGLAQTTMIFVRVDLAGVWILGRSYSDVTGNDYYHGKALTQDPTNPGGYFLGFEHSAIATQPFDQIGMAQVDPVGNPLWLNSYVGAGFFAGSNYILNGVRTDGGSILTAGWFTSPASPGNPSAFTTWIDLGGMGINYNEYETPGAYPPSGNFFWGMDYNMLFGTYDMVGSFRTLPTTGGWPQGPNPVSFYMVGSNPDGTSSCSAKDVANTIPRSPANPFMWNNQFTQPAPIAPILNRRTVDPRNSDQCTYPKRSYAGLDAQEAEGLSGLNIIHGTDGNIYLEIDGEIQGEGMLHLVDMNGKILSELEPVQGKRILNTDGLSQGIYFLRYDIPGVGAGAEKLMVQ
jgi:hypothetical protein